MAEDFLAGCLGGFAGLLVGHPFDTVKVRLQGQDSTNKIYNGTWNCFTKIVKTESVFGLYKGFWVPLYGQIALNSLFFGVHGNVIKILGHNDLLTQFIAGCVAGVPQCFICSPMELVKTRLQMQISKTPQNSLCKEKYIYAGIFDCIRKIYKYENGYRGLFRGFYATLWREVPSSGCYFSSYFYLCDKTGAITDEHIHLGRLLFCGGVAGIVCWSSTYPFDVIKTRLQTDGMGKQLYNGIIDCALKSYKNEGISVFFYGLNATLISAFPYNAAMLGTVTLFLNFVGKADFPEWKW